MRPSLLGPICPYAKSAIGCETENSYMAAKMYVMPQLGMRISWRERCKPTPGTRICLLFPGPYPSYQLSELERQFRSSRGNQSFFSFNHRSASSGNFLSKL